MLRYHRGDERPAWQATVTVNGAAPDLSSGYTYALKLASSPDGTAVLTKTTGIAGDASGVVTVTWAAGDLDLTPGTYVAQLRATSSSLDWTISDTIVILPAIT